MNRLDTIREKLFRLIEEDKSFKVFGSNEPWNGHQYILNPTLSDEELNDFENFVDVKLPHEYRSFLHTVADGGAGPFYGLYSLNEGVEQLGLTDESTQQDFRDRLAKFPLTKEESTRYAEELFMSENGRKTYFDRDDYPEQAFFQNTHSRSRVQGVIYLSQYGCGGYYVLVVAGNCYGQVWYTQEGHLAPLCHNDGSIFSFFDWYEYWLDKSLHLVASQ